MPEHGPHYDTWSLSQEEFSSIEEAEKALETYFDKYEKEYEQICTEDFTLLSVYSAF
jgi:hypothetical protein